MSADWGQLEAKPTQPTRFLPGPLRGGPGSIGDGRICVCFKGAPSKWRGCHLQNGWFHLQNGWKSPKPGFNRRWSDMGLFQRGTFKVGGFLVSL